MRGIDFSSWQSLLSTLFALVLVTMLGVGVRLLAMTTIQQRRERANRQINERLRTLIAAYKALGGSFTGDLSVDPTHLRDLKRRQRKEGIAAEELSEGSDRTRRMRDAVEAALSDIILLGTEEQVRLAAEAARELVDEKRVHTHELVVSLRNFIRHALDLEVIAPSLEIPRQGPARQGSGGGGGRSGGGGGQGGGGGRGGGGGGGGGGAMGMGMGMGMGGMMAGQGGDTEPEQR